MNQAVDWIKSNLLIVIFSVLILAAFVAIPIVSGGMNAKVETVIDARVQKANKLSTLSNTSVQLENPDPRFPAGQSQQALINQAAVDEAQQFVEQRERDVEEVVKLAEIHNRQSRNVLSTGLFPKPAVGQEDLQIIAFSKALNEAYEELLEEIHAGSPPAYEEVRSTLDTRQKQFITRQSKGSYDDLTEEEIERLVKELSTARLGIYSERAKTISLYASLDVINPPYWDIGEGAQPTLTELFYWQWDFWAIEDVLRAIGDVNAGSNSVLTSPVKRIKEIYMTDTPVFKRDKQRGGGGFAGGGGDDSGGGGNFFLAGGGAGGGGADLSGGGGGGGNPTPPPGGGSGNQSGSTSTAGSFDPSAEIPRDFSATFTGRTSNGLYDVRYMNLHLVVETNRINEVLDALGTRNFMTVVGLETWPTDAYADLQNGYMYGPNATSELVLTLETVWLRSWTSERMPDELKSTLGIPVQPAGQQGDGNS